MFSTFVALLQLLAPFLKESVFGTATFKEWLKHNLVSCLWILLLMSMLGIVFYVTDQLAMSRREATDMGHKLELAQAEFKGLEARALLLDTDLRLERTRAEPRDKQIITLTEENTVLMGKVHTYESWLTHWGVDLEYAGTGYPALPVAHLAPRPKKPQDKPSPPKPVPANRNVLQRLKDWGKDSKDPPPP